MDYDNIHRELANTFYRQVEGRFKKMCSTGGVDIGIKKSDNDITWTYKEVKCHGKFGGNDNYPVAFFFNIEFVNQGLLAEKVDESFSSTEIEHTSHLGRPQRLTHLFEDTPDGMIINYFVKCPIITVPKNESQRSAIVGNLWGKLAGKILGTATGVI